MIATVRMQGVDVHGWDTRDMESMDDIRAYLRSPHYGSITAIINGEQRFEVPAGLCNLRPRENRFRDEEDMDYGFY